MRNTLPVILSAGLLWLAACASSSPAQPTTSAPAVAPASTPAAMAPAPVRGVPTAAAPATVAPTLGALTSPLAAAPQPVAQAARAALAGALGVPQDKITLVASEQVEWPDACLGVTRPGQMCAQIVTPGYRLTFATPQGAYEVHTDLRGTEVRWTASGGTPAGVEPGQSPLATPAADSLPPAVVAAQSVVARQLGLAPDQVTLVSQEAVDWPNSCLGAAKSGESCLQVITAGYRAVFSTPKGTVEAHTNRTGAAVRIVTPAGATPTPG